LPFNKLDHLAAPSVLIVVIGLNKVHLIDPWEILEICD
jgi:hypothetical protein